MHVKKNKSKDNLTVHVHVQVAVKLHMSKIRKVVFGVSCIGLTKVPINYIAKSYTT